MFYGSVDWSGEHVGGLYGVVVGDSVRGHHGDGAALRDCDGDIGVHVLWEGVHHVREHGGDHVGGALYDWLHILVRFFADVVAVLRSVVPVVHEAASVRVGNRCWYVRIYV